MKLNVAVLNPAGNITLIVTTPVDKTSYAAVAARLLEIPCLGGEQVGFLQQPKHGGMIRLDMMGGEFCGNALRCAGYFYALKQGIHGRTVVPTEISGSNWPLNVEVDMEERTAKAEMPLPISVQDITLKGCAVKVVSFEGIIHFVVHLPEPDQELIEAAVDHALGNCDAAAVGVMFFDGGSMSMRPAVYVHDTGSLIYEKSCASGSAAVALVCAVDLPVGNYRFDVRQPGGIIEVELSKQVGGFEKLTIGGRVSMDLETTIHLDF